MMIKNAELKFNNKPLTSTEQVKELQSIMDEASDERIIKAKGGTAEIYIKGNALCLTSGGDKGMIVNESGTTIDGQFHIAKSPDDVRINGFWKFNHELLTTVPSTLYTPIPVLVYDEHPAVKTIQSIVKFLSELKG